MCVWTLIPRISCWLLGFPMVMSIGNNRHKIIAYLLVRCGEDVTPSEIADKLRKKRQIVSYHLNQLVGRFRIVKKVGLGRYRIDFCGAVEYLISGLRTIRLDGLVEHVLRLAEESTRGDMSLEELKKRIKGCLDTLAKRGVLMCGLGDTYVVRRPNHLIRDFLRRYEIHYSMVHIDGVEFIKIELGAYPIYVKAYYSLSEKDLELIRTGDVGSDAQKLEQILDIIHSVLDIKVGALNIGRLLPKLRDKETIIFFIGCDILRNYTQEEIETLNRAFNRLAKKHHLGFAYHYEDALKIFYNSLKQLVRNAHQKLKIIFVRDIEHIISIITKKIAEFGELS